LLGVHPWADSVSTPAGVAGVAVMMSFLLLLLLLLRAQYGHTFASNTPIVGVDFINNHKRCGWVFVEDALQQVGDALDQLGFLFGGRPFTGDLNIDKWHGDFLMGYMVVTMRQA
jgi:hypothetical protein